MTHNLSASAHTMLLPVLLYMERFWLSSLVSLSISGCLMHGDYMRLVKDSTQAVRTCNGLAIIDLMMVPVASALVCD